MGPSTDCQRHEMGSASDLYNPFIGLTQAVIICTFKVLIWHWLMGRAEWEREIDAIRDIFRKPKHECFLKL